MTKDLNRPGQHIALVANTSWSIYNFRLGLIKALIQAGHQVYAIAPRDDYSDKLTAIGATYIPLKMEAYTTSPIDGIRTFIHLLKIYRKYRFDRIIHYTIKVNIFGSISARVLGLSSIMVITGLGRTFQFKGLSQWIIKSLYRIGVKCSEDVWFLNDEDRDRFVSERLVDLEHTFILPSEGINTSKFRTTELYRNEHKVTRLLFAGRLLKDKGILEFVEAAKILTAKNSKLKFEVVGFVNPKNIMSVTLEQIECWQRSGWINYLGSHEDIRPFIHRADCIVFPSYYQEGVSRILLEAASMSRPIITTNQTGCRDVVIDGYNGLLVEPRSVQSLTAAILKFLALSYESRLLMGTSGRKKVKAEYDEHIVIDIYLQKLFGAPQSIEIPEAQRST